MTAATALEVAILRWYAYGENGVSSETLARHLGGVRLSGWDSEPLDPADFRRCELLLRAVPLLRLRLPEMAAVSPIWAELAARWDEISELLELEIPGIYGAGWPRKASAPRTYALMQQIRGAK